MLDAVLLHQFFLGLGGVGHNQTVVLEPGGDVHRPHHGRVEHDYNVRFGDARAQIYEIVGDPRERHHRRGAPVMAFMRVADDFIYLRTGVTEPDVVVVLDPTVMGAVDVTSGLKDNGLIVANTSKTKEELVEKYGIKHPLYIVNANKIAVEEIGRPITNTTMMGALVKATGLVELSSVEKQIEHRFPAI